MKKSTFIKNLKAEIQGAIHNTDATLMDLGGNLFVVQKNMDDAVNRKEILRINCDLFGEDTAIVFFEYKGTKTYLEIIYDKVSSVRVKYTGGDKMDLLINMVI